MQEQDQTEVEPRETCYRCKKRRYRSKMTLVFYHPLISGREIWGCNQTWRIDGCVEPIKKELLMYNNTGLLQVIPANQLTDGRKKR